MKSADETPAPQTLAQLFAGAVAAYAERNAFRTRGRTITYREFGRDVRRAASALVRRGLKQCRICETDSYLFAVGFFAAMLSGTLAELDQPDADSQWVWESLCDSNPEEVTPVLDPDAPAIVLFSSGTTGRRKEILLSQRSLAISTWAGLQVHPYPCGSRLLHVVPLYHAFGLECELLAGVYAGCCLCLGDSVLHFLGDLRLFQPDFLNLPPMMVEQLENVISLRGAEAVTGGRLRYILCCGAHLEADAVRRMERHGITVLTCYGLSEAPGSCINTRWDNRPDTVGRPCGCCQAAISPEGEILLRGPHIMLGYRGRQQQPFTIREGERWLCTGDAGTLDEEGFLHVRGRMDELMVFSDGRKAAPEQFEHLLLTLPELRQCRVFMGERDRLTAEIVTECPGDALDRQIRAFEVEGHRIAEIRVVPRVPTTETGKVVRHE